MIRGHIRPRGSLANRIASAIVDSAGNVFAETEDRTDKQIEDEVRGQIDRGNYRAEDEWSKQRIRIGQNLFRKDVISNFKGRCCVCGLDIAELLDAAHIHEWGVYKDNRLNPRNVFCLCKLHHKAFDIGLISIDGDRRISISGKFISASEAARAAILAYDGKEILPAARWTDLLL